jgi:hypothetical protein
LGLEDNIDTVYNISLDRLGSEDNIDTVYNISLDRILSSKPSLSTLML